jgi:hypothetical protein
MVAEDERPAVPHSFGAIPGLTHEFGELLVGDGVLRNEEGAQSVRNP